MLLDNIISGLLGISLKSLLR